jgi:hypothetical protein
MLISANPAGVFICIVVEFYMLAREFPFSSNIYKPNDEVGLVDEGFIIIYSIWIVILAFT